MNGGGAALNHLPLIRPFSIGGIFREWESKNKKKYHSARKFRLVADGPYSVEVCNVIARVVETGLLLSEGRTVVKCILKAIKAGIGQSLIPSLLLYQQHSRCYCF